MNSLEYRQEYYLANRDKILSQAKQWQKDNPERYFENQREWREDNPEYMREYQKANPEIFNINTKKHQELEKQATDPTANLDTIEVFYEQARRLTANTGIKFEVDHIIPPSKGGKHHENNLQVIPEAIHLRKNAKILNNPIWATEEFSLTN